MYIGLLRELISDVWCVESRFVNQYDQLRKRILAGEKLDADFKRGDFEIQSYSGFDIDFENELKDKEEEVQCMVIELKGAMTKNGTLCSYGTSEIAPVMKAVADTDNVCAIVIDGDSGGGSMAAIAPMIEAIKYAKERGKVVLAHFDAAYSAAYWVASACDMIMLDNDINSGCGSIGVMCEFVDDTQALEKDGYKVHRIYSDLSGEKNAEYEAALGGDYQKMKETVLNPSAEKFRNAVINNRGAKLKLNTEGLLSGKTFDAKESIACGLADAVMTLDETVKKAVEMAGKKLRVKS